MLGCEEVMGMWVCVFLFFGLLWGTIGAGMAERRNRSRFGGFALGFLLGLVGLAIIALMGKREVAGRPPGGS